MPIPSYTDIQITIDQAAHIAKKYYGIIGDVNHLPGELDFNFKIKTPNNTSYILKISRPDVAAEYLDFQNKILQHLGSFTDTISAPNLLPSLDGLLIFSILDDHHRPRLVRLLTWIEGRLWSQVNPISDQLLYELGQKGGQITTALSTFNHSFAQRNFDWDNDQALWTIGYQHLFDSEERGLVAHFMDIFAEKMEDIRRLRKGIIHNDTNDNNILVSSDLLHPSVAAIIDFGDAIHTSIINDLAISIAYAVMSKPDPLAAACHIVGGYHASFPINDAELEILHLQVAIRLIISVTKSAINKQAEPDNTYLLISEKPAWELLNKWRQISPAFAYYSFRQACGLDAHPNALRFAKWSKENTFNINNLFPSIGYSNVSHLDMSIGSHWLGHRTNFTDDDLMTFKIQQWLKQHPDAIPANGYLETRAFYSTDAYRKEGNNGPEYRTVHLGVDFWVDGMTPLHSPFDGEVHSIFNNDQDKDYGPTIILKHRYDTDQSFYTLYGHLSTSTLSLVTEGQPICKGQHIGYIGLHHENGQWTPHLHFQIMMDMLGNTHDFPGVAVYNEIAIWQSICPDPNLFLRKEALKKTVHESAVKILKYRTQHLGKSLSVSYDRPLQIVRGEGTYLLDDTGRKYLDTVNNVAHVGHENYNVVKAAQEQIALLNTNTRYLHPAINELTQTLLSTLPPELCVVHYVNSGSEANELALRMAYTCTQYKDVIAVEHGYHGNTNECIAVSSYKFDGKGGQGKPETTHLIPLPDEFRGRYRGVGAGYKYAEHIYDLLAQIDAKKGSGLAAFIHESIISCGGQIPLPKGFLLQAYDTIRAAGGLCIADEVQTGCGRLGTHWWAFEQHGVIPDIVTVGKPLGNGHPIAAVICTRKVADSFANGMEFFSTFGGNPVSCVIANDVLNTVKNEYLMTNATTVGIFLIDGLTKLQKQFPILADIRGSGLFLGIELTDDNLQPLPKQTAYIANRMRQLGILMSTDGPDHNVLKIKPPMVFSLQNATELLMRMEQVLKEDYMMIL